MSLCKRLPEGIFKVNYGRQSTVYYASHPLSSQQPSTWQPYRRLLCEAKRPWQLCFWLFCSVTCIAKHQHPIKKKIIAQIHNKSILMYIIYVYNTIWLYNYIYSNDVVQCFFTMVPRPGCRTKAKRSTRVNHCEFDAFIFETLLGDMWAVKSCSCLESRESTLGMLGIQTRLVDWPKEPVTLW
jgi:hypothetical protein